MRRSNGPSSLSTWGAILGPLIVRLWLEALALRSEATSATQPFGKLIEDRDAPRCNKQFIWLRTIVPFIPHRFALLKQDKRRAKLYDFDEYQWLVDAAHKLDSRIHVAVLLGGDAGLRRGEIMALEWSDVDLRRGQLSIERLAWKSEVTATKGMKVRVVPMTQRLQQALAAFRG